MAGEAILTTESAASEPRLVTVSGVMNAVGTSLILFLMAVMLIDIGGRLAFNRPLAGVPEMVSMAIVAIVFLQLPHAVASGAMIRTDVLIAVLEKSRPKVAASIEVTCALVGAGVFAAITWASWRFLVRAWGNEDTYGTQGLFEFPEWPLRTVVVLGAAWTMAEFLRIAMRQARRFTAPQSESTP
ncbi:MAG: TRAP transporter small permease subunit [Bosea sp. (in: a-proteobacteria)]